MLLVIAALASCDLPDSRVCDVLERKPEMAVVREPEKTSAKKHFDSILLDGPAARWKFTHKSAGFVCGFVNGKNRAGAYTGWQPFYYNVENELGRIFSPGDRVWLWDTICLGEEYMNDRR
jgi:hypothetical protein